MRNARVLVVKKNNRKNFRHPSRRGWGIRELIFTSLLFFLNSHSIAASFDCAQSKIDVEVLICMDYRLSVLDEQLSSSYKSVLESGDAVRGDQEAWLASRNRCKEFSCVVDAYVSRLKAVNPKSEPVFDNEEGGRDPWQFNPYPKGATFNGYIHEDVNGDPVASEFLHSPPYGESGVNLRTGLPASISQSLKNEGSGFLKLSSSTLIDGHPVTFGGGEIVSMGLNYLSCGVPIHRVGISLKVADDHSGSGRVRRVVMLEKLEKPQTGMFGLGCSDEEKNLDLHVVPRDLGNDIIWRGSYYAVSSGYIVRFDSHMRTYAPIVGRSLFIPSGRDLDQLLGRGCELSSSEGAFVQECIDKKLVELVKTVENFYK